MASVYDKIHKDNAGSKSRPDIKKNSGSWDAGKKV
jgi:hypothetical protein